MEEHNEAYYYWNLFIEKGYIGKSGMLIFVFLQYILPCRGKYGFFVRQT